MSSVDPRAKFLASLLPGQPLSTQGQMGTTNTTDPNYHPLQDRANDVDNFIKSVLRAAPRAAMSIPLTLSEEMGGKMTEIDPNKQGAMTPVYQTIYGNEPIKGLHGQAKDNANTLNKFGVNPNVSAAAGIPLAIGSTALDLSGLSPEKKAAEEGIDTTIKAGVKTAAEIQAEKAAGKGFVTNSADNIAHEVETGLVDAKGNPIKSTAKYANPENVKTTPLSAGTEEGLPPIGEKPGAVPPNEEIPNAQQTSNVDPSGRTHAPGAETKADITANQKRGLLRSDEIPTPQRAAQVHATLNGYGITGTADEQLGKIADQKGILSTQAESQVAKDGGQTAKSDLLKNMTHDLAYNGAKHPIDPADIPNKASQYLNNVYIRATGGDPTKVFGDIMPENIPDSVVQKMKSLMGKDASGTFSKDAAAWTPSEQIARFGRNSFDTLLDVKHPEASILNNDMNDLYAAEESLTKNANTEIKGTAKAANAPQPSLLDKIKAHPIASTIIGLGTTGATSYGLSKIPYGDITGNIMNDVTGNKSAGATKSLTLDTSPSSHMPSDQIKKSTGLGYTFDDYQRDIQSPQYVPGSNFKNTVDTKMQATNTAATQNLPGNTASFMGGTAQQALNAQEQLKNVNIEGLSSVNQRLKTVQAFNTYTQNADNPYSKELISLRNANVQYQQAVRDVTGKDPGEDSLISPGDTPETMRQKLQTQNKFIKDTYKQYQPYWDAKNPTNQTTTDQTTYNQNTGSGLPGASGGALPPIPSGFDMQQLTP